MDEELEYEELDDTPQKLSSSVWKKIIKLVLKKKRYIIIMLISIVCVALLDVLTPLLNSKVLEVFFGDNPDFTKKWQYISLYVLIANTYYMNNEVERSIFSYRAAVNLRPENDEYKLVFAQVLDDYIEENRKGDIIAAF